SSAGSTAGARGYDLAGASWSRHSCAALPPCRTFGSASDPSSGATSASTRDRSEAHQLGNRRHGAPIAVARHVLSAGSCRTIHVEATRRTLGALLRRGIER